MVLSFNCLTHIISLFLILTNLKKDESNPTGVILYFFFSLVRLALAICLDCWNKKSLKHVEIIQKIIVVLCLFNYHRFLLIENSDDILSLFLRNILIMVILMTFIQGNWVFLSITYSIHWIAQIIGIILLKKYKLGSTDSPWSMKSV